jgi:hypothetical protein
LSSVEPLVSKKLKVNLFEVQTAQLPAVLLLLHSKVRRGVSSILNLKLTPLADVANNMNRTVAPADEEHDNSAADVAGGRFKLPAASCQLSRCGCIDLGRQVRKATEELPCAAVI